MEFCQFLVEGNCRHSVVLCNLRDKHRGNRLEYYIAVVNLWFHLTDVTRQLDYLLALLVDCLALLGVLDEQSFLFLVECGNLLLLFLQCHLLLGCKHKSLAEGLGNCKATCALFHFKFLPAVDYLLSEQCVVTTGKNETTFLGECVTRSLLVVFVLVRPQRKIAFGYSLCDNTSNVSHNVTMSFTSYFSYFKRGHCFLTYI